MTSQWRQCALLWSTFILLVGPSLVSVQEPAPIVASRIWTRAEFLLWRVRNDETPFPTVTAGPAGTPNSGVLGDPSTRILYGDQLDYRLNGGARLTFGWWFDDVQFLGVELRGFCLETHTIHGEFESNRTDGAPTIARPFFNLLTGQPDARIVTTNQDSLGGAYLGGIDVFGDSRTWGGEANVLSRVADGEGWRVFLIGGFRNLGQKDQLRFSESSTVLSPGTVGFGGKSAPAPDIVSLRDYFETTNFYYGAQVGAQANLQRGRWLLDLAATIGAGANDQRQEIAGHTLLTDSTGFTQKLDGALYATPDILGHHQQWHFGWASELNARVGFAVTPRIQLAFGYTFLFWDGVIRPGHQLPSGIDPRQVPSELAYEGPNADRTPPFRTTSFWAQGLSIGVGLQF